MAEIHRDLWLPICRFVGCCRHVWFFVIAQVYIDSRGHVNHEALSCFVVVVWCCLSFGSFPYKSFLILFLWSLLLSFLYLGEQMEQAPEEAVTSFDGTFTTVRFQGFRFWHVQTLMGRNCLRSWGEMGCQLLITMCYCKLFLQLFELTDLTVWGLATMEPICLHLKFSWKLPQDSAVFELKSPNSGIRLFGWCRPQCIRSILIVQILGHCRSVFILCLRATPGGLGDISLG